MRQEERGFGRFQHIPGRAADNGLPKAHMAISAHDNEIGAEGCRFVLENLRNRPITGGSGADFNVDPVPGQNQRHVGTRHLAVIVRPGHRIDNYQSDLVRRLQNGQSV